MGNALFIVWRESVEAMLVVGILFSWLRVHDTTGRGMRFLVGGVAAGVGLAVLLALAMHVAESLSTDAMNYFQLAMVLVAAVLIVQMVVWMRQHGRKLKRELEGGMAKNLESANWWGMLVVVMLAVGRESAETVVFLYGLGVQQSSALELATILGGGLLLALASFWVLQRGSRIFSWNHFFRLSEILLLLLAAALLVTGMEKLINLGALPALLDPVWDSSSWLDDTSRFGGVVSALTGYRAQPALTQVLIYVAYWCGVSMMLRRVQR